MITVQVQLVFNETDLAGTELTVTVENIRQGATAYDVLEKAKFLNPCYRATYRKRSYGRSVTSICCVRSDWRKRHYWVIYINGKPAQYGVDGLEPKDGDLITFKYQKVNF